MRKLKHEEINRADPKEIHLLPRHPITVILENIRSLYNVGSIFRTSDAAGIEKIYLTGISGTPENHAIHKTALGSQDTVPWEYCRTSTEVIRRLRENGYTIAVLEITTEPAYAADLREEQFPICLIVGNEIDGVSDESIAMADLALEIPQYGAKHSLNAAVAFGIMAFDLVRRYKELAPETR